MRFSEIKQKLYQIGFDDFCQAGSVSKFHPMNIVAESRVLNLQFWVCADGGYGVLETYHISERPLNNYMAPAKRTNFRTQAEVVTALEGIRLRIVEAQRLSNGSVDFLWYGNLVDEAEAKRRNQAMEAAGLKILSMRPVNRLPTNKMYLELIREANEEAGDEQAQK